MHAILTRCLCPGHWVPHESIQGPSTGKSGPKCYATWLRGLCYIIGTRFYIRRCQVGRDITPVEVEMQIRALPQYATAFGCLKGLKYASLIYTCKFCIVPATSQGILRKLKQLQESFQFLYGSCTHTTQNLALSGAKHYVWVAVR